MDNTKEPPTILSLCTGYGGIEIGLERAIGKINILAHVEIEAYADANLVAKMETGQLVPSPLWTNLKTLRPEIFRNKVDILTGGYPCQPFSAAGQRKGKDDPRHLWPWIREIIKGVRPGLCFFENVEGHISLGLREVLTDLVKLGYRVENDCGEPTWGLFSAAEVGAPHQRKRVFILAYSEHAIRWNSENWLQHQAIRRPCSRKIRKTSFISRNQLANPRSSKFNRIPEPEERWKNREVGNSGAELVNTKCKRPQGARYSRQTRKAVTTTTDHQWPARPGQPQYEWEEPRTVADTMQYVKPKKRKPTNGGKQKPTTETGSGDRRRDKPEAKPELGGTAYWHTGRVDPTVNRVDRLRLCGNGVVPGTAEKAWRTLMNRIINPNPAYVQPSVQLELFERTK